ncbi:MAG: SIR2 family NAD-dependent protein deacylase [Janthinobacterium lividum]
MDEREQLEELIRVARGLQADQYEAAQAFNEGFDGVLTRIKGLPPTPGEPSLEYKFRPSQILFWLDPIAYQNEKGQFENRGLQAQHQAATALLQTDPQQLSTFRSAADAVRRKRVVPFVGAGLSMALKPRLPGWIAALQQMRTARAGFRKGAEFDDCLRRGDVLAAAQLLYRDSPALTDNFIRTIFTIADYSAVQLVGGVQLLPQLCGGCIVTTNFDNAIEETFRAVGNPFDGYMHGTQEHNFFPRLVQGERCLLKLHGDATDNRTYIFTQQQYEANYRAGGQFDFNKPLPKALRQIYIGNSLLFLGCSLAQDWTMELFQQVKQGREYEVPTHYALLEKPRLRADVRRKETALLACNIHPIWYPNGDHSMVQKLLHLLIAVAERRLAL